MKRLIDPEVVTLEKVQEMCNRHIGKVVGPMFLHELVHEIIQKLGTSQRDRDSLIDWDCIPEGYRYAAMDKSGNWYLYLCEPYLNMDGGLWKLPSGYYEEDYAFIPLKTGDAIEWNHSLQVRPET